MDRISVSTWSLHRTLGPIWNYQPEAQPVGKETPFGEGDTDLLDLPAKLKDFGIDQLEICSFHLRSLSETYLSELRAALAESDIKLQTLLIEAGDVSDEKVAARDLAFVVDWVERADALGAQYARVIAGKMPPSKENLERSARNLKELIKVSENLDVRVASENWFDLLSGPDEVLWLMDEVGDGLALNGDLGNWSQPQKYDGLRQIMGRAEICHAKASFVDGKMDEADYGRCLQICEEAGYKGPYTLIFDSDDLSEWDGLAIEREFVLNQIAS